MECHACGAELDPRDKFCSKCGAVTQRGKSPGELAGRYGAEAADGLGKLFSAALGFATAPENRTKVAFGTGIAVLLLVSLTSNPISGSIGGLFEPEPEGPTFSEDGTPNFADYEDVFLGGDGSYLVTGQANIRDFPTSQGTGVIGALSEGETVIAREVRAFDPGSQWLKLASGGYVWGQNLREVGEATESNDLAEEGANGIETMAVFAPDLNGKWSSLDSCTGPGPDAFVEISGNEIRIHESLGRLERISKDERGNSVYHIAFTSARESWPESLRISLTANGFSLIIEDVMNSDQPDRIYHLADAGCRPVSIM